MRETTASLNSGKINTFLKSNYLFSTEHFLIAKNFIKLAYANLKDLADFTEYGTVTDLDLHRLLKIKIIAIKKSINQKTEEIEMCDVFNKIQKNVGNNLKQNNETDIVSFNKELNQAKRELELLENKNKPREIFLIYSNF